MWLDDITFPWGSTSLSSCSLAVPLTGLVPLPDLKAGMSQGSTNPPIDLISKM